ncbi:MAG: ArsR/SmtB family transcription factor [Bacillota bacterium]
MEKKVQTTANLLKSLSSARRLQIINLLSYGEMCVCDLTENIDASQPNISHHLKVLKNAGLIQSKKSGKWVFYELNQEKLDKLQTDLDFIINTQPEEQSIEIAKCNRRS